MEPGYILGAVKGGRFVRLSEGNPAEARLTTTAPQEAISPEAQEVPLQDLEGMLLLVRGIDQGAWIYSATAVDVHGGGAPPPVEFVRTLFRIDAVAAAFEGITKPDVPEPKDGDLTKFSEGVTQETLVEARLPNGMRVHRITYRPGAHTHWHWHEGEQALYAIDGTGWVRQDGRAPVPLETARIVYVTPGARHWHGAASDQDFVHLAFTASGRTEWQEPVTEEEYRSVAGDAPGG